MKQIEGMPGLLESLVGHAKFIVDNKRFSRYDAFFIGVSMGKIFHDDAETIKELQDWAEAAERRRVAAKQ